MHPGKCGNRTQVSKENNVSFRLRDWWGGWGTSHYHSGRLRISLFHHLQLIVYHLFGNLRRKSLPLRWLPKHMRVVLPKTRRFATLTTFQFERRLLSLGVLYIGCPAYSLHDQNVAICCDQSPSILLKGPSILIVVWANLIIKSGQVSTPKTSHRCRWSHVLVVRFCGTISWLQGVVIAMPFTQHVQWERMRPSGLWTSNSEWVFGMDPAILTWLKNTLWR